MMQLIRRWTSVSGPRLIWVIAVGLGIALATGDVRAQDASAEPPASTAPNAQGGEAEADLRKNFRGAGVQTLDDLRSLVIEGPPESVEALSKLIAELDRLSSGAEAAIEVVRLQNADSQSLAEALRNVYESRETARAQQRRNRGQAAFVPIAQPNAVVIVAPRAEIDEIVAFARKLDQNTTLADRQFRVFRLQRASASIVRDKLLEFFANREEDASLRVRVEVVSDDRTNAVIVYAGPADLDQTARLIEQLDGNQTEVVKELRIFPLKFASAQTVADLINQAIAQQAQVVAPQAATPRPAGNQQRSPAAPGSAAATAKSARLRFADGDAIGQAIESGILEDINVNADTRTNAVVVTAPASSMNLIQALVNQLDREPGAAQTVRVFTLRNSNAEELFQTLQRIFLGTTTGQTGARPATGTGAVQPAPVGGVAATQTAGGTTTPGSSAAGISSLSGLPIRITPDYRTNSIVATGSEADLVRAEEIVLQLDSPESKKRETVVYRLNNLTAVEAVQSLTQYLSRERLQDQITVISVQQDRAQQDQSQDVVSANSSQQSDNRTPLEPQTNSIIITATPGLLERFLQVVEEIDARPPQVIIQVLIAQIELNNNDEFGLEVGFQNDVLFDRSLIVGNQGAGRDTLNPGFNFNTTAPLQSPFGANADSGGIQGLSNFALGRASQLGYGGLIFAASSDNISVLLRALKRQRRLDVLSRPQVMTLDNQQASIQIGQRIRVPTGAVTAAQGGTTSTFQPENIGIILAVTPRISPEGRILMRVAPQISSLQRNSAGAIEGLPVGINQDQTVAQTPIINITEAVTTVSAMDGETVVIGGLITKETSIEERELPWLGDIPYLEWLFKTRFRGVTKRELLIILTPHVVAADSDADRIKQIESCRIDWIMSDVEEVHGDIGVYCPKPNCDKDGKKCHDPKTGPVLNLPLSTTLPRSVPKHKRPDPNCPPNATETFGGFEDVECIEPTLSNPSTPPTEGSPGPSNIDPPAEQMELVPQDAGASVPVPRAAIQSVAGSKVAPSTSSPPLQPRRWIGSVPRVRNQVR
jgi:type II secretion system protein D